MQIVLNDLRACQATSDNATCQYSEKMNPSFVRQCQSCGQPDLLRCPDCEAVLYCCPEHQATDRPNHEPLCDAVQQAQRNFDLEVTRLMLHPGDLEMAARPLENSVSVGHFWDIPGTQPYMRARYTLALALLELNSRDAIQLAHDHFTEMLHLSRLDSIGVRDLIPALKLRLGNDQECYEFVKWCEEISVCSGGDWSEDWEGIDCMQRPDDFTIQPADAYEPVDLFASDRANLAHSVAITLVKIRLLYAESLKYSVPIGHAPQQLPETSYGQPVGSVRDSKDILLRSQIEQLYHAIYKNNNFFWGALLQPPGTHLRTALSVPPPEPERGSLEEMEQVLQHSYASWAETFGAIEHIRALASVS